MFRFRIPFALFILCLFHASAQAQTETILHNFGYFPQGAAPCGTVLRDSAGDLYGTTLQGGTTNNGVVFERTASGTYTVLYSFKGQPDAALPNAGVTEDAAGNLYGTTTAGGAYNQGTIYKLTPGGAETVLYSFTGTTDGANIYGGVALDAAGNLYGTAEAGGSLNYGTVWKFSAAGQFTVLHNFAGAPGDGANPDAGVTLDAQGNLYGTTSLGGATLNLGTVFKLSPGGAYTLLHNFTKVPQTYPQSGLAIDGAGNLYGAVEGAAYEVSASGVYTQFNLPRGADASVAGTPAMDGAGNLYVVSGGGNQYPESGVILKVNPTSGQASVLYVFPGPPDEGAAATGGGCAEGYKTAPGVVLDASGNVYGSSQYFGLGGGIFEIGAATGAESTLYRFPAARGGSMPNQIIRDRSGVIFGITQIGGTWNGGALYELESGVERTLPLPVQVVAPNFGQDAQRNLYVCGGVVAQEIYSIYKISSSGTSTLLYTFTDGSNCLGVTADAAGNVYGTTADTSTSGGQVFRVTASGDFTSLYVFSGGSDGGTLNPDLTLDKKGNVYGVTSYGGVGGGVIYRVSPNGTETVLHEFVAETGAEPIGSGVVIDGSGNLYGTATNNGPNRQGVIYKLSSEGEYSVLYGFTGEQDGGQPTTNVALDAAGNLYGTAQIGGDLGCSPTIGGAPTGCGVLFEFSKAGSYSVLHAFTGGAEDGAQPSSAPVLDGQGNIYGATSDGGPANYGAVYKITP